MLSYMANLKSNGQPILHRNLINNAKREQLNGAVGTFLKGREQARIRNDQPLVAGCSRSIAVLHLILRGNSLTAADRLIAEATHEGNEDMVAAYRSIRHTAAIGA